MFPYRITVEWSQEDEAYVARVPALPGCAAHGETEAEAVGEVRVAADLILQEMKAEGQKAPLSDASADYSGNIRLRLPRSLHRDLDQLAGADGVSLNQKMVELLARGLNADAVFISGETGTVTTLEAKATAKDVFEALFDDAVKFVIAEMKGKTIYDAGHGPQPKPRPLKKSSPPKKSAHGKRA
jgi:predicted RNase H-like HicB family nuclease